MRQHGILVAQLRTDRPYTMDCPFPVKSAPSASRGDMDPHLILDSLRQSEPIIQTASPLVQPFLHSSPQSVPKLYNGPPLPLKIAPSREGIWTSIQYMIHLAYRSPKPKRHLDRFSSFSGLTTVTTDRPRPHLRTFLRRCGLIITSGQSNLTKGRITAYTVFPILYNWSPSP